MLASRRDVEISFRVLSYMLALPAPKKITVFVIVKLRCAACNVLYCGKGKKGKEEENIEKFESIL